jgi:hypothetical protein
MQRLRDAAEMLFEPTGDLWKDYSAYCEIDDKAERDDLVDAIQVTEVRDKPQTNIIARNLEYCLNKRDAMPLTNAIPHCHTLSRVHLTGCGVTEHSLKLFCEAVYKSPSVTSVAVDFNPNGLYKDPTVSKKDKNELMVSPSHFRGAHLRAPEADPRDAEKGKAGKADAKKPPAKVAPVVEEAPPEKGPFAIPTGWHGLLITGVQQLSLRGNGITDKQIESMLPLLEANTDLLSLSLWGNAITSVGAASLATALKTNRKLTALNLGHNKLDDAALAAFAAVFYTVDVSNDDASKLRMRTLKVQTSDLPVYPSYADLFGVPPEKPDEKKEKKKETGKGKKADAPVEKLKGDFDRDCIRIDDGHVRVPGNTVLWALNFSQNSGITATGVSAITEMLNTREPSYDTGIPFDGNVPAPYATSVALERVDVLHPAMDAAVQERLQGVITDHAEHAQAVSGATAAQ